MNQQINLYRQRASAATQGASAVMIAASLAGLAAILVGLTVLKRHQLDGLEEALAAAQTRESAILTRLESLGQSLNVTDEADLATVLEQATRSLQENERVLAILEQPAFGHPEGFSRYLAALARRELDGLWLTRVTVTAPGNRVALTGRTVRPDLVPEYLKALSDERAFTGQRFSHFLMERPAPETGGGFSFSIRSESEERLARIHGGDSP